MGSDYALFWCTGDLPLLIVPVVGGCGQSVSWRTEFGASVSLEGGVPNFKIHENHKN